MSTLGEPISQRGATNRYAERMPIDLSALIDPAGPAPFRQLAAALRDAINDGRLEPGEKLPSEAEMMELTGLSRETVRKATALLDAEGLIVKRQGAPTRVTD